MKPSFIYLIRHGESEGNLDKKIYRHTPDWKVNLTEKGKEQAIAAGRELWNDYQKECKKLEEKYGCSLRFGHENRNDFVFYTSPWYRTRQTTELINHFLKYTVKEDPRLREQEWGNYAEEHLSIKIEKERKKFGSFFYRMPCGESGADVYDRITTFIDTLHRDFEKEDFPFAAVIISHGLTVKAFLMRWFHYSVEDFDSFRNPKNCEIFKMILNEDRKKYTLATPLKIRSI